MSVLRLKGLEGRVEEAWQRFMAFFWNHQCLASILMVERNQIVQGLV